MFVEGAVIKLTWNPYNNTSTRPPPPPGCFFPAEPAQKHLAISWRKQAYSMSNREGYDFFFSTLAVLHLGVPGHANNLDGGTQVCRPLHNYEPSFLSPAFRVRTYTVKSKAMCGLLCLRPMCMSWMSRHARRRSLGRKKETLHRCGSNPFTCRM